MDYIFTIYISLCHLYLLIYKSLHGSSIFICCIKIQLGNFGLKRVHFKTHFHLNAISAAWLIKLFLPGTTVDSCIKMEKYCNKVHTF